MNDPAQRRAAGLLFHEAALELNLANPLEVLSPELAVDAMISDGWGIKVGATILKRELLRDRRARHALTVPIALLPGVVRFHKEGERPIARIGGELVDMHAVPGSQAIGGHEATISPRLQRLVHDEKEFVRGTISCCYQSSAPDRGSGLLGEVLVDAIVLAIGGTRHAWAASGRLRFSEDFWGEVAGHIGVGAAVEEP